MKRLRRNTDITDTHYEFKKFAGLSVGLGLARTNNGVGFATMTIKSKLEPKEDRTLATGVMYGRFQKALKQYKKGDGRVTVKMTTLIPAKSMPERVPENT